jgi:hypothetical protein
MKLILAGLLFSFMAHGNNDLAHMPKSFTIPQGKAVFVDFKEVSYVITYNSLTRKAEAQATIQFDSPHKGFPIFDSVAAPWSVVLDGEAQVARSVSTPTSETTVRIIEKEVAANSSHVLVIQLPLRDLVEFTQEGVKSAFWMSDLEERKFLERYLPANLEFDQVKMSFHVKFLGAKKKQVIYTNGKVSELGDNEFYVQYPEYYTASSIFFHTVPEGSVNELRFSLRSRTGRDVPVVIYQQKSLLGETSLSELKDLTSAVFHELEGDYGAWPHPSVLIYNAGRGGMEYCGATITATNALGHELFHSYFARGFMPANGNSGWIDEAFASWRDEGYQTLAKLTGTSRMSSHPYYERTTDRDAYSFGEHFMRYLDNRLSESGGLKPFMRHLIETRLFRPTFVEEFIQEMNSFYTDSFDADFKKYTFSRRGWAPRVKSESKFHPKMSLEELRNHL